MKRLYPEDTIAAIATAPGEAGICVVRLSGDDAVAVAGRIFESKGPTLDDRDAGTFVHGYVNGPRGHIDEVLCLISRAPHSYTGEDLIELQGHGGRICARRILRAALDSGARLAEPGEFTRRAFLNGRMDLVQAEAVLDLIRARSERASTAALEQLEGSLSARFNQLYDGVMGLAADLEATLDFPEDELPEAVLPNILKQLIVLEEQVLQLVGSWDEGQLLRDGALVVISGKPNVGKSTLLNALLESGRAIVSDAPGTTRDTIEEELVLQGIPIRLVDTAGLRDTDCDIEQQGIDRTHNLRNKADLHVYLLDDSQPLDADSKEHILELNPSRTLLIANKTDLGSVLDPTSIKGYQLIKSCLTEGEGLEEIRSEMVDRLASDLDLSARPQAVISERHRRLLADCSIELGSGIELLQSGEEAKTALAASQLRLVLELLGQVTGRDYGEELLDEVFSRFCIGK